MRIAIIGAGRMGASLARLWARCGYRITVTNSRGPTTMAELISHLGSGAGATFNLQAIRWAHVIVLTLPWRARTEIVRNAAWQSNKIVLDVMNAYDPYPRIADLGGISSSVMLASELNGAPVVKALNTIQASHLHRALQSRSLPLRTPVPMCGDDADAKSVVGRLIEVIGFEPVDMGSLLNGHLIEPGQPLFGRRFSAGQLRSEFQKHAKELQILRNRPSTLI